MEAGRRGIGYRQAQLTRNTQTLWADRREIVRAACRSRRLRGSQRRAAGVAAPATDVRRGAPRPPDRAEPSSTAHRQHCSLLNPAPVDPFAPLREVSGHQQFLSATAANDLHRRLSWSRSTRSSEAAQVVPDRRPCRIHKRLRAATTSRLDYSARGSASCACLLSAARVPPGGPPLKKSPARPATPAADRCSRGSSGASPTSADPGTLSPEHLK